MNTKEIIKYLKTTISEKGEYCYSLSKQTTKAIIKHIDKQEEEIEKLNNIINELENTLLSRYEYMKDSEDISLYAQATEDKIIYKELQELKDSDKE